MKGRRIPVPPNGAFPTLEQPGDYCGPLMGFTAVLWRKRRKPNAGARGVNRRAAWAELVLIFIVGVINQPKAAIALPLSTEPHVVVCPAVVLVHDFPNDEDFPPLSFELANVSRFGCVDCAQINSVGYKLDFGFAALDDRIRLDKGKPSAIGRGTQRKVIFAKINTNMAQDYSGVTTADIYNGQGGSDIAPMRKSYRGRDRAFFVRQRDVPDYQPRALVGNKLQAPNGVLLRLNISLATSNEHLPIGNTGGHNIEPRYFFAGFPQSQSEYRDRDCGECSEKSVVILNEADRRHHNFIGGAIIIVGLLAFAICSIGWKN